MLLNLKHLIFLITLIYSTKSYNQSYFNKKFGQLDVEAQKCQDIKSVFGEKIDGKTRNYATIFAILTKDPGESTPILVRSQAFDKYFTFVYEENKDSSISPPPYKVTIKPHDKPTDSSDIVVDTLMLNFDANDKPVVFEDAVCTETLAKTNWLCICCEQGKCGEKHPNPPPPAQTVKPPNKKPDSPQNNSTNPIDICKDPTSDSTKKLCDISKTPINSTNLDSKITQTEQAFNTEDTERDDLVVLSDIMQKMSYVDDANVKQRHNIIGLMDKISGVNEESFESDNRVVSDRFIQATHTVLIGSKEDISYLKGSNLGAHKTTIPCSSDQKWTGLIDSGGDEGFLTDENGKGQSSIWLLNDKLCDNENQAKSSSSKIQANDIKTSAYFLISRNDKLFYHGEEKSGSSDKKTRCKKGYDPTNGFVLTSVVWNSNNFTSKINAQLRFKKENFEKPPHSNLAVTWWDKTKWSENKQCKLVLEGDEYVAECDHLTNFALLVEKSPTDPLLCNNTLDTLGLCLSIISLVCLFILSLVYLTRLLPKIKEHILIKVLNNHRRQGTDNLIIAYVLVMLLFYFFFTIFIDQSVTNSKVFCKLTAAFLYFLFLSAMFLNLFQAWDMIKMCAWNSRMEQVLQILTSIRVAFPVSFGLPFLVTLIVFFANGPFFFRDDQFCWIRPQNVISAVLIPVTLMLINSFVAFGIFCVRMFPDFFKHFGIKGSAVQLSKGEKQARRMNLELFIVLMFAQFILGFPWILQYPAMFSSGSTAWHWLFALFNGTNGLILFLIYFYGRFMAFYRLNKNQTSTYVGTTKSTNIVSESNASTIKKQDEDDEKFENDSSSNSD